MKSSSFLQKTTLILLHLLFALVPFFFTWINEELFEFNKMILTYVLGSLIIGCWFARMAVTQKLIFKRTPLDWPLLAFLVSQIISTLLSIHPYTSVFGYYTRFHGGLLSSFIYVGLYYSIVNTVEKKQLPSLFLTLIASALGVSLYAIPEHFGASPSCWLIYQKWDVQCWIQDVQTRVFATFGQPNWLAAYVGMLLPVSLSLTLIQKKVSSRFFYFLSSSALFMTLLFTKSRSGFLAVGVGMAVWMIGWLLWSRFRKESLTLSVIGLAFLAGVFGTPLTPSLQDLWAKRQVDQTAVISAPAPSESPAPAVNRLEEGGTDSGEIRKIVWEGAFRVWQRHFLFGSGVETFAYSYYLDRPVEHNNVSEWDFLYNKAHNEFLNFLATTGIVGFVAYCSVLVWFGGISLKSLYELRSSEQSKTSTSDQTHFLLILGMLCGIIILSISNFFGFSTVMVTILLFSFFGFVVVLNRSETQEAELEKQELSVLQYGYLAVIAVVCFYTLSISYYIWMADYSFTYGKGLMATGSYAAGLAQLQNAATLRPKEALYYDELANWYSQLAVELQKQGDSTTSSQLAQAAVQSSNLALNLNSRHLNFYKTRTRVFITLAQLDLNLLKEAQKSLETAITLAPTDPKLRYNLALVVAGLDQSDLAIAYLKEAIELKPNYESAHAELARLYQDKGQYQEALSEYNYIIEKLNPGNQGVIEKKQLLEASISAQTKPN